MVYIYIDIMKGIYNRRIKQMIMASGHGDENVEPYVLVLVLVLALYIHGQ